MNPAEVDDANTELGYSDTAAVFYGVCAMALALIPTLFLIAGFDEGPQGHWTFADLKNWVGLARFSLGSLVALAPTLYLARMGRDRARHTVAALPAAIATVLAMPLIPGAVIQVIWWFAG